MNLLPSLASRQHLHNRESRDTRLPHSHYTSFEGEIRSGWRLRDVEVGRHVDRLKLDPAFGVLAVMVSVQVCFHYCSGKLVMGNEVCKLRLSNTHRLYDMDKLHN